MNIILDRLKEIVTAVMYAAEATELEVVLERIAHVTRELAATKYAALGIPDDKGGLKYFKVSGISPQAVKEMDHLPRGEGLIGAIMHERRPIRLNRMSQDDRSAGFPANHPMMRSFLGVPVQIGQQLFGMLYLTDRLDGQPFDETDEWLVETMAGYAALAIAGANISEQQSHMRLLEERERIGMELHDGVIQSLYAIGMHLDLIRQAHDGDSFDVQPIIDGLNNVIEDIRRYIMNLRSGEERQKTVYECFQEMLSRLHVPETLNVSIDAPREMPSFSLAAFEGVCLIVNEALSNAVRHAQATQISIRADEKNGQFTIVIMDNGRGFKLNGHTNQTGLGLRNMQRRARIYGGKVDIETAPGEGTRLVIRVPVGVY